MSQPIPSSNLTLRPPRSPRVRLGGYVILPRLLDKGRAKLQGTLGDYSYACPLDARFHDFAGTTPEEILNLLLEGKGDGEVLAWIRKHGRHFRSDFEIEAWSALQEKRAPGNVGYREHFLESHRQLAPERDDISTGFDLLDLDDYVSYGGKP